MDASTPKFTESEKTPSEQKNWTLWPVKPVQDTILKQATPIKTDTSIPDSEAPAHL